MENYEQISESCKLLWIDKFQFKGEKYTQVSGYIFNDKNQLLIVRNGKVWTIPGGHPEPNENTLETLNREIMEEACITLENVEYLGAVEVIEDNEKYYQLRYTAKVKEILPFKEEWEISERLFVDLEDLSKYITWSKGVTFSKQVEAAKNHWKIK